MLATRRRLQHGCPSCTAQILRFYISSIAEIAPAATAPRRATRPVFSRTQCRTRAGAARLFSTSSTRLQETRPENENKDQSLQPGQLPDKAVRQQDEHASDEQIAEEAADELDEEFDRLLDEGFDPEEDQHQSDEEPVADAPEEADPETVVRRAKRMFGNTLPPDYLSAEEYRIYTRLYGSPLRATSPEDVGFGSFGEEDFEEPKRPPPKAMLLRQDADGTLEEIEYTAEKLQEVRLNEEGEEDILAEEEEEPEIEARPPNEAQIEFIEANASTEREYEALLRLQQDFEVARIKAIQQQRQMDKENAAEEQDEDEDIEEEQEVDEDEEEEDPEAAEIRSWFPDAQGARVHQFTAEGRFTTSPRTLHLPRTDFVQPINEMLKRTDTVHIRATAEKHFGGPGLPHSPATPSFAKNMQQKGLGLEAAFPKMTAIEADAFISTALPGIYASAMSALVEVRKRLGPEWIRSLLNRKDDDGAGPRVLDVGAGGAGLSAWQNVLQTEWNMLREGDKDLPAEPPGKRTVIVGSYHLRSRISQFLHNTQFLPRLPNYASIDNSEKQLDAPEVPQKRKVYDVIIATHVLVPMDKEWRRRDFLNQLWSMLSPNGGVLIVLEKGHPRGFEAVAEVRQRLLDEFILAPTAKPRWQTTQPELEERIREPGMIIAPCTNHSKCPMYLTPGISPGRKDFCHFSQRFIRPQFLQKIMGASHRNHEDINFSYVAIRRGMPAKTEEAGIDVDKSDDTSPSSSVFARAARMLNDAQVNPFPQGEVATEAALKGYESVAADSASRPHPLSLPRNVFPPLKRKGHVTLDLCTPAGTIERWTVPKSFSKQAYHDARKARWGDLWALGAKTRVRRNIRLGRGVKEGERVPDDAGIRAARAAALNGFDAKGRRVNGRKLNVIDVEQNEVGMLAARSKGLQSKRPERRTKGGRLPPRERNKMNLDDFDG
ncbi:mitochondrial small ribosomal subunit Rsm22-domain-containing protein [Coniella lustricola]|uniref:Mitochondrial small ribosomal subunit Rsm22-domain-containing protein n=1 Tax=Coniella lustricola TaxID=2025994 RepID=A0A2T3A9H2_9PEZI|nr:mitochondrial small ribosomal subunit Rsm22-domain-containing protein [Coniella lustricola]